MRTAFLTGSIRSTAMRPLNCAPYLERIRQSKGGRYVLLREILSEMGAGYKRIFTNVDASPEHGIEVLSQSDMFAAEPAGRFIRKDCLPQPQKHQIKKWQILVAGAGTLGETELYGRPIIADDRLAGKYVAYHALDLAFADPGCDLNLYAYGFLLSRFGLQGMRSTSYGTKILSLRRDLVADIPLPIPHDDLVGRIAGAVRRSVEQREAYYHELHLARGIVEALPEMREAHAMCAERQAQATLWSDELPTLTAWTYASAGNALAYLRRAWRRRLVDVVRPDGMYYGLLRQRTPCAAGHGVPLISQRDMLSVRPIPMWIAAPRMEHKALFSEPGTIVMAGVGGVGEGHAVAIPAYVTEALSRFAFTQHILRIVPQPEWSAVLHTFLSTLVGRRLLRTAAAGTIVLQLRTDLLQKLPIPELDEHTRRSIGQHHSAAMKAYDAAMAAETEAIRIIEDEVLPAWLA